MTITATAPLPLRGRASNDPSRTGNAWRAGPATV